MTPLSSLKGTGWTVLAPQKRHFFLEFLSTFVRLALTSLSSVDGKYPLSNPSTMVVVES